MNAFFLYLFDRIPLSGYLKEIAAWAIILAGLGLALFILNAVIKGILKSAVQKAVRKTHGEWDDILYDSGTIAALGKAVLPVLAKLFLTVLSPAGLAGAAGGLAAAGSAGNARFASFLIRCTDAWIAFALGSAAAAFLDAVNELYRAKNPELAKKKPIKGYLQLVKIFIWILTAIIAVTEILNISPVGLLSGVGAMSAVLLLVFKDSIMGFVSSIQLTANDLVRIGDWIEMPKYGADGDVIDITLQTILVRNWDLSVTSIPIYALTSDSFKNWRSMAEAPGRRIKRTINIDMKTVRFLEDEDVERLSRIPLLAPWLAGRQAEIQAWNAERGIEGDGRVAGRHLTNLGTFRAYAEAYITAHPDIQPSMTRMARYLEAGATGLPLELYVFSREKAWVQYEGIIADIVDHLLSVMGEFGLRVFQNPSGWDMEKAMKGI